MTFPQWKIHQGEENRKSYGYWSKSVPQSLDGYIILQGEVPQLCEPW